MEVDIYHDQLLLGPAEPPAHYKEPNFFDDMSAHAVGDTQDSSSPGDMTLVGPESNLNLESQSLATTSSAHHVPSTLKNELDPDHLRAVDVLMEDLVAEQDIKSDAPPYTSKKKRKRISLLSAAKKARTGEPAVYHEKQIHASPSMVRFDTNRATEAVCDDTSSNHIADADDPSITSRPTSWPRSRLFRRSAGVSVKKITEVFEKLRLHCDKPLPALPAAASL